MKRKKTNILLLLSTPLFIYLGLLSLYFLIPAGSTFNGLKYVHSRIWFVPQKNWHGEATTILGRKPPVKTYTMRGHDMPIILHVDGYVRKPLFHSQDTGDKCCGDKSNREWFAIYVSNDKVWGRTLSTPFWFPWMEIEFNPKFDDWNEMNGNGEWSIQSLMNGDSIFFHNSILSVCLTKRE